MILRALSTDPEERDMPAFWAVGAGSKGPRSSESNGAGPLGAVTGAARGAASAATGLSRAAIRARPRRGRRRRPSGSLPRPGSALRGTLAGQRRFATQQYELQKLKDLAKAAGCTLNDVVLYLCGTALRRYLTQHEHAARSAADGRDPGQPP